VGGPRSSASTILRHPTFGLADLPTHRLVLEPIWIATLVSLVACQRAGDRWPGDRLPEGYSYSYAMRDCAPWDGPAVTVFLTATPADSTSVPTPFLGLSTYRSPTEVEGRRFEWPAKEQVAGAYRCRAEGDCEASRLGYIRFDRSLLDGTLIGGFVAQFPHDTVAGGFKATWVARRVMCG